jgi:twitching motility protein PilT
MPNLDALLAEVVSRNGSDLHLAQGQRPKIRIHGSLSPVESHAAVLTQESLARDLPELCSPQVWEKFNRTGDADFAYQLKDGTRFRCNFFRHFYGYGAVFRMIPSRVLTLEDLKVPQVIKHIIQAKAGMILVTGPTGSGKSSTQAAIIHYINQNWHKKIVTIEEPVEFFHQNLKSLVVHREVGLDTPTFAQGLRGILKSDVDIVLVGEMRDRETIELALTAAEMGMLVFGTLHTNSAAKSVDRIIDSFPPNKKNQIKEVLANTLQAVVSQQLLVSKTGDYRVVACEILIRTSGMPSIIRAGEVYKLNDEIERNKGIGMISMDSSLMNLIEAGHITRQAAYMKALDKHLFEEGKQPSPPEEYA